MKREFETHLRAYRLRLQRLRRLLKPLPRRANVGKYPVIRWFAEAARKRPWLWSFKPAHVVPALYSGAVIGLLPIPGQLLLGFAAALLLRANFPLIGALCFATNPLTMVPLFTACYVTGYNIIHWISPGAKEFRLGEGLQAMTHGDFSGAGDILAAVFLGAIPVGLAAGVVLHLLWRFGAWEARVFKDKLVRLRAAAHRQTEDSAAASAPVQPPVPVAPPADASSPRADKPDSR